MTERVGLITGFPSFRARALLRELVRSVADSKWIVLVHPARHEEATNDLENLGLLDVEIVAGDPSAIDFGLAGRDYLALARRVTHVHHLYQTLDHALDHKQAFAINAASMREVIEFGLAAKALERIVEYSSVFVSGDREGVVLEEELEAGQGFHSAAEETLALSEAMLRRRAEALPITVIRAGHVVGDTTSGRVEHLDGPYSLIVFLLESPDEITLPLPPRADATLQLLPSDFLAKTGASLCFDPNALGKTLHLVDPAPVSSRRFLELAAEQCGKRLVSGLGPAPFTRNLFSNPATRLVATKLKELHDRMTTRVAYDDRTASSLLKSHHLACPPLSSYLPALVAHARERVENHHIEGRSSKDAPFLVS